MVAHDLWPQMRFHQQRGWTWRVGVKLAFHVRGALLVEKRFAGIRQDQVLNEGIVRRLRLVIQPDPPTLTLRILVEVQCFDHGVDFVPFAWVCASLILD